MSVGDTAKELKDLNPFDWFPYASYMPHRTNGGGYDNGKSFKRHRTLSHAKSAVSGVGEYKLYKFNVELEEWEEYNGN